MGRAHPVRSTAMRTQEPAFTVRRYLHANFMYFLTWAFTVSIKNYDSNLIVS